MFTRTKMVIVFPFIGFSWGNSFGWSHVISLKKASKATTGTLNPRNMTASMLCALEQSKMFDDAGDRILSLQVEEAIIEDGAIKTRKMMAMFEGLWRSHKSGQIVRSAAHPRIRVAQAVLVQLVWPTINLATRTNAQFGTCSCVWEDFAVNIC